jgi:hypothetical protein
MDASYVRLTMHWGKPDRCDRCGEPTMRFLAFMSAGGVLAEAFVYCDNCDDFSADHVG